MKLAFLVLLAACDHFSPGPMSQDCENLVAQFKADIADPGGSCVVDADCVMVGGAMDPGCFGSPTIGYCGGEVVPTSSPKLSEVRHLAAQAYANDCLRGGADNCPPSTPFCYNGRCSWSGNMCVHEDAGAAPPTPSAEPATSSP